MQGRHTQTAMVLRPHTKPFLAIGVLSRSSSDGESSRRIVRVGWAAHAVQLQDHSRAVFVRFVLPRPADRSSPLWEEQQTHQDLALLSDVYEGNGYGTKMFSWMRYALHLQSLYVASVDDDVYVDVDMILHDLRALESVGLKCIAYGAVEWFAYERNTGKAQAWGYSPRNAGQRWVFHINAYVPRANRSSIDSGLRSPVTATERAYADRTRWAAQLLPLSATTGNQVLEHWLHDVEEISPVSARGVRKAGLSLPFPFLKVRSCACVVVSM